MSLLRNAYKSVASQRKEFCVLNESVDPKDDPSFLSVVCLRKGNHIIPIDHDTINQNIEDLTIIKTYITSNLVDNDLKLIAIAQLGFQFLQMRCELEDAEEAKNIINEALDKKYMELR